MICKICRYEFTAKQCNACKVRHQRDRLRKAGRMKIVYGSKFETYITAGIKAAKKKERSA